MPELLLFLLTGPAFVCIMVVIIYIYSKMCTRTEFVLGIISSLVLVWWGLSLHARQLDYKGYIADVHIQYNVPFSYDENDRPFRLPDEALMLKNPEVKVIYAPAKWVYGVFFLRDFKFEVREKNLETL